MAWHAKPAARSLLRGAHMKHDCHRHELADHWTLSADERALLANKTGATRLAFAFLLKLFQRDGRFPERREPIADTLVLYLAQQVGVSADAYGAVDWSERTQRQHRAQIRAYCGFRTFGAEDEPAFVAWLSQRVTTPNPEAEALKLAAYSHLRTQQIEPPRADRLQRLLREAVRQREQQLVAATVAQLPAAVCRALDALIQTSTPDEEESPIDQAPLFPIRSELATLKEDAGAVKVETVLEEIEKLKHLRRLGLPEELFREVPTQLVSHYRQRAAREKPRDRRRHPADIRYTLLAALCWQRQREITDTLVDLLIHIAHRIGVRAAEKVDVALMQSAKKVVGKSRLLYKLAKAAKGQPDGRVKDVIYPVVGEQTLDEVIREAEAEAGHEGQVKRLTRSSYSHHYRRIVPALLAVLVFKGDHARHRPLLAALALLQRYREHKTPLFPRQESVPLDGVVKADWQEFVLEDKQGGRAQWAPDRISYEICVLTTLREKLRCKEIWVAGAHRFRNPDEDLPQDFAARRDEYYAALEHPREATVFVAQVRRAL